jgi:hypothetical protein
MRKVRTVVAAAATALALASIALGATMYAGPQQWGRGQGAGSSYSANWHENYFDTYGSGYDKAVTFIDNKSYSWHNTIRNRNGETKTYAPWPLIAKAHCVAYDGGFWGSCTVW